MKKNSKKDCKNKTTDLFKYEMLSRTILPSLNWKGASMVYPYKWNGIVKYAIVELKVKWDKKKL